MISAECGVWLWIITRMVKIRETTPCDNCYQTLQVSGRSCCSFGYHTFVHSNCYTSKQECTENGQTYWMAQNNGWQGKWVGMTSCPTGERWVCFSRTGQRGTCDGGMQDQAREQGVKEQISHLHTLRKKKSNSPLCEEIQKEL